MKRIVFVYLVCGVMILGGITGCWKNELKEAEKDLQEMQEKYGWVETITVSELIAKFNTEIMDGGLNTPAYDDYLTIQDDVYWFDLTEDISYYLQPVSFTGNKENDICEMSAIYFKKYNYQEKLANQYVESLIKANHYDLSSEEIIHLMKEAKDLSSTKKTANNGKGISVGFLENTDYYIYQVIRLYK